MTILCTGQVRGADGKFVDGAAVMVVWGTAPTPEIALRTDMQGRFRVALPKGRFRIEAYGSDGTRGSAEVDIDEKPRAVDIQLQ